MFVSDQLLAAIALKSDFCVAASVVITHCGAIPLEGMKMADVVQGFRDAIQDLPVPELKAMRVEMGALKDGIKQNAQAIVELR